MRYKLAMNKLDLSQPPWRLIDEQGNSMYFKEVQCFCKTWTLANLVRDVEYTGWLVVEGTLEIDHVAQKAIIR